MKKSIYKLSELDGVSGVYMIHNSESGLSYIGSAKDIAIRLTNHFSCNNIIMSNPLYLDILSYSWNVFEFYLLDTLESPTSEQLETLEFDYIEKYSTLYPNGYNIVARCNSEYKKWLEIDYKTLSVQRNMIDSSGLDIFLENCMRKSSFYLPTYVYEHIVQNRVHGYFDLSYFAEYYINSNVIMLSPSIAKLDGESALDILNRFSNNGKAYFSKGLEKVLNYYQIEVDEHTFVKLHRGFNFKKSLNRHITRNDTFSIYREKYERPITNDIIARTFSISLNKFYGSQKSLNSFKFGCFKRGNDLLIVIKYYAIGHPDNNIKEVIKKIINNASSPLYIDDNALAIYIENIDWNIDDVIRNVVDPIKNAIKMDLLPDDVQENLKVVF